MEISRSGITFQTKKHIIFIWFPWSLDRWQPKGDVLGYHNFIFFSYRNTDLVDVRNTLLSFISKREND